jgi:hypothetical protein
MLALALRASVLVAALWQAGLCAAAESDLQLRIAWGGGSRRQWTGTITLTEGKLNLHRPLGVEADEPGSIWVEENRLEIRQPSPREYDGVDIFVQAPLTAKLLVSMSADPRAPPVQQEVMLGDLVSKPYSGQLDELRNRILIRRAPGDILRVRLPHNALVFSCGESITIDVKPYLLPAAEGATLPIRCKLIAASSGVEHWSYEETVTRAGDGTSPELVTLSLTAPETEGVYDLVIEACDRNPLRWTKPIATRRIQLLVLSPERPEVAADKTPWEKAIEIDPANPGWADRLKHLTWIPGWRNAPLGNGRTKVRSHPLGPLIQLEPAPAAEDASWEAYPLSVSEPGTPHIVEVDIPSDVVQTLGVSIVEPNAAGSVTPVGLDSGVFTTEAPPGSSPAWQKHRLLFWPRTKSPLLLLINRRTGQAAAYGKIRLLHGPSRLPPAFPAPFGGGNRLFAAYLDRPLFNENFGAAESLDSWSGRSLDDWRTFYQGASRLVEYMDYVGYNALMIAAAVDGSSIYPSDVLQPTPTYDTGPFFDSGQDPYRKDVLELLLKLFDREDKRLIPLVHFSAPLPALEERLRRENPQISGVALIGADGRTYTAVQPPQRGLAPYYNPLNADVQEAVLAAIRELVRRYAGHSSLGGLAVGLTGKGFLQLPGEAWGFDDATIAEFERDNAIHVPGTGPERFRLRAHYLLGEERKTWLAWRARKLADFHLRMQRELAEVRPDAIFYLAPVDLFDTPQSRRALRPALPGRVETEEVLLSLGIQPANYREQDGLVFLRTHRVSPPGALSDEALDMALAQSNVLDAFSDQSAAPASLLWHPPQTLRLASFEAQSPFGKDRTYAWLVEQFSPAGSGSRARFIRALVNLDSQEIFAGGWLLPLGQEAPLASFVAAYRRLPRERFETIACDEPVKVRTLVREHESYAYFVNDSAWPVSLEMDVEIQAGARADELSSLRRLPPIVGGRWKLELEPYDFVAVRFGSSQLRFANIVVKTPAAVRLALQRRIDELWRCRAILVTNAPPLRGLKNPDFEQSTTGEPDHWTLIANPEQSATVEVDSHGGFGGSGAIRLTSHGAIASLYSEPFPMPPTGRLSLSVRLRGEPGSPQPALRLAVEGRVNDTVYSPFAVVGGAAGGVAIPTDWEASQFILRIDDVPMAGLSELRVRIDLAGPGSVWVDDIKLMHLDFSDVELGQLSKILSLATLMLDKGKWGECQRELDSYWPRFLIANVPVTAHEGSVSEIHRPTDAIREKQASRPGPIDRVREWWRR